MLIGIAGSKMSGKDTLANYFMGEELLKLELTDRYFVDKDGKLNVTYSETVNGQENRFMAPFEHMYPDPNIQTFLSNNVDQYIRIFHFADPLKVFIHDYLGVDWSNLYLDKDSPTNIRRDNLTKILSHDKEALEIINDEEGEYVSGRILMQTVSRIIRKLNDESFTAKTMSDIVSFGSKKSIVADIRREAEVDAIREAGGIVIYLTAIRHNDKAKIEHELKHVDKSKFTLIIDNQNIPHEEVWEIIKESVALKGYL